MTFTGSISGTGSGISGLLRLRRSPLASSHAIPAALRPAGSVGDGGNLICGRQLRPSLFQGKAPSLLPKIAGKPKILPPIDAAASSSPAEGSDSAGEAPVPFTVKYQALITGSFFFTWYFLNVIFNILNKKIYNYFPYPYFVSVIHLFVGVVYCLVSWVVGLPKRAMASGGGDEPPHRSFTSQVYRKSKLLVTKVRGGGREDSTTPPHSATPQIVPSTFPSSSQQAALPFPTTPGYYYFSGPPPAAQHHTGASTSQPPPDTAPTDEHDSRILIVPEGDIFYPSQEPTHKVRDIIRSRFDAPYVSWKKIPLNVRDMWFGEFEIDFRWLPQHNDRVRKNFEKRGSTRLRDMFTSVRKKGERPLWIGEEVWADLCAAWGTPEYAQKRAQNKGNRASDSSGMGTSLHTGGSIPHAEHRRRLEKSLGRQPTVLEVHTRTHQRQETQEWVTPKAQKAYEDYMQLSQSQGSAGEGASSTATSRRSEYELWTEAVGGIQKGRIYGLGSEAGTYRSHAYTPSDADIEERLRTRLRDEIRAEVRADMAAEVDARFAQINKNIEAGFERMTREMWQRREPPMEPANEETESDRDD